MAVSVPTAKDQPPMPPAMTPEPTNLPAMLEELITNATNFVEVLTRIDPPVLITFVKPGGKRPGEIINDLRATMARIADLIANGRPEALQEAKYLAEIWKMDPNASPRLPA